MVSSRILSGTASIPHIPPILILFRPSNSWFFFLRAFGDQGDTLFVSFSCFHRSLSLSFYPRGRLCPRRINWIDHTSATRSFSLWASSVSLPHHTLFCVLTRNGSIWCHTLTQHVRLDSAQLRVRRFAGFRAGFRLIQYRAIS